MKTVEELMDKARQLEQERSWKELPEAYERVLKYYPEHFEAWLSLAESQATLGKPRAALVSLHAGLDLKIEGEGLEDALRVVERILELRPSDTDARHKRIDLLFRHGQTEPAIAYSRTLAQYYQAQDDGEKAIKLLVRAFQLKPQDDELIAILAEAYLSHGQLREATGLFRQVIPIYLQRQDLEKAVAILRRLIVVNPKDIQTPMELGELYLQMGRFQEAEQQFRTVLRTDLQHREALLKVAQVSCLRQQFRDATLVYQRLLTTDASDTEALQGLANVYKQQGMPQDATKHFLMAGLACVEQDDKEQARQCFSSVLELDPQNNIAARQLAVLS